MKIREKLFLGFGLYIFLAAVLGFFSYIELRTITTRLTLVEIADDITNAILEVRRHEKNFLLFKDKESLEELKEYLNALKNSIDNIRSEIIGEIGEGNYNMMKMEIAEYEKLVNNLTENLESKDYVEKMRLRARNIQSFTESLSKKERADIAEVSKRSIWLLLYAILAIIIMGTIVNAKLTRSIAAPIRTLEKITKRVAAGDFSEHIEVKGKDELASLEASFNQMEDRLKDAMASLEHAIKKLHEKQEELVEAEKLASLGRIAAGVAHEINNPLAIINEKAGLMEDILKSSKDSPNKERFLNLISGILNSINRCRAITHSLLGFARRIEVSIKPLNLNEVAKEVKGFLEKEISRKNIKMSLNLNEEIPEIKSDKGQIEQVLLNIIKNAIDVVNEYGLVEVSTGVKDEGRVYISVRDNGPGMPKDKLKQIFEPFFTTKERGKGTGLGLFVSYGIMKGLGGNIHVESEAGKGSAFTIELPVTAEALKEEMHEEG